MSLRFRLNLIVSLLVVTFLLIMAGVVIVDARQSIREELDTETTVTLQILSSVLSDRSVSEQDEEPSDAMRSLLHGLGRVHATGIRLFRDDGTLSYASSSTMREPDRTAPSWFADLATPTIPVRELAMPGGRVVLTSDPSSALYEKWEDLRSLARLAIGVLVVVNIAVFWLLGRALKPIENVLDGLSEMERGRLDTRLPRFVLPELEAIGRTFNRMADALESSHAANARLALVAKQSSDAIMIHDLEGRITFWNPAAERLFDYRSEEIMGRPADLLEPPDAEREGAEGAPTVGGSWTLENRETRRMARNGRVVHVALSAAPLVDPGSGIMIGRVYAMRDVTERKLAEETERELVENRRFTQRMQTRLEEERRAIARELHDELGQYVTAIKTIGAAIANRTSADTPEVHHGAQTIVEVASHIYDVVHGIIRQLRPSALDHLGLPAAIEELVKSWCQRHPELRCSLRQASDIGDLGEEINIAVYRVVQECLTNVIRHSGAAHVEVEITREAGDLRVRVADDGTGLTESDESGRVRLGLVGMRERVQALGGDFRAISTPGAGFGVAATIPVPAQPPAGIRNDPSGVEANGVAR